MNGTASIWVVTAEFTERDDAVALMDLAKELGVTMTMAARQVNIARTPTRDQRLGRFILRAMDEGRSYGLEYLAAAAEEHEYKGNSVSAILSKLVAEGDVERLGVGVYRRIVRKPEA